MSGSTTQAVQIVEPYVAPPGAFMHVTTLPALPPPPPTLAALLANLSNRLTGSDQATVLAALAVVARAQPNLAP